MKCIRHSKGGRMPANIVKKEKIRRDPNDHGLTSARLEEHLSSGPPSRSSGVALRVG